MAGNSNLQMSRVGKTDEFYTQLSTIEDELRHYRHYFRDKIIFCNADDPAIGEDGQDHFGDGKGGYTSNFFRYFQLNFYQLGIKKLITTHYVSSGSSYKFEIVSMDNGNQIGLPDYVKTPLAGNGDFRSFECLELLRECDVVVTNPPFSLMKEYIPIIQESGKKFIVLANTNHVTMKEVFYHFKKNNMWLGYNAGHFWFRVPDYYEEKKTDFRIDETGQKWRRMGNCCWFTNFDIDVRHQPMSLYKRYTPEEYLTYDGFNIINVDRTSDIPFDYSGIMGVPITFLDKYCPEQFEILGIANSARWLGYECYTVINGKKIYNRVLIRNKNPGKSEDGLI